MFFKILLTGVAAAALVLAQEGGGPGGGGPGGGPGGGMGGGGGSTAMRKLSKAEQFADKLKLNKDQQKEVQAILEAAAKESAPVVQQLSQSRMALAAGYVNNKPQADLDHLYQAMTDAQQRMTEVETKAFQQVLAVLKPNQAAKAADAFDVMGGLFEPQPGGNAGRGGMGRGGAGRGGPGGGGPGGGR